MLPSNLVMPLILYQRLNPSDGAGAADVHSQVMHMHYNKVATVADSTAKYVASFQEHCECCDLQLGYSDDLAHSRACRRPHALHISCWPNLLQAGVLLVLQLLHTGSCDQM